MFIIFRGKGIFLNDFLKEIGFGKHIIKIIKNKFIVDTGTIKINQILGWNIKIGNTFLKCAFVMNFFQLLTWTY